MAERLVVEKATKTYHGGNHALRGPSFTVEPGSFMVLLGPSGSGKTTLLRSLAGIERLTSGRVVIGDTVVADGRTHLPPERRDLSMVFQDYALWPHLCARDNVAFALRRRRLPRTIARARAHEMLERVGLAHLSERFPSQLSGGEQQRVALARALVADTGLLLCDEPLSNLDADLRERMRVEISSLVRDAGATTIYITHDQQEAFALADQVGLLEQGRLVQHGTPEHVYSSPSTLFVARFTGLAAELEASVLPGSVRGPFVEVVPLSEPARRPVQARTGVLAGDVPGDLRGVLAVRPAAVRLCAPEAEDAHFAGAVADTAFRGRHYELVIDLPSGTRLTGVVSERRVPRGAAVGVRLDASASILFARASPAPDRPGACGPDPGPPPEGAAGKGTGARPMPDQRHATMRTVVAPFAGEPPPP